MLCSILLLSHARTENKQVMQQQTKCRVKSVLRRLHRREQHKKICKDSSERSCRVDLHVVIAMGYTALKFSLNKKGKFGVMWAADTSAMRRSKG